MTNRTFASAIFAWAVLEIVFLLSLAAPAPGSALPLA